MTYTLHPYPIFPQRSYDFTFYAAGDGDAVEGAVDVFHAAEGAGVAFAEEVLTVACGGGGEVGVGGEGVVGFACGFAAGCQRYRNWEVIRRE